MSEAFDRVDRRTLVIVEAADVRESNSASRVYVFSLEDGDTAEITSKISEVFKEKGWPSNLTVQDLRGWVETGAGASSQDVILTIGTAITSGVAGVVIKEVISWAKKKAGDRGNQGIAHADEYLEKSKYEVIKHFKVQGELETVKVLKTASGSEAVFRDSQDNRYTIKVDKAGNVEIEKVATTKP